jgi:signal transduction histidine kinase
VRRFSLRTRLTVIFVSLSAVLVFAAFAGSAWLLHRAVWAPLDAALHEEAESFDVIEDAPAGTMGADRSPIHPPVDASDLGPAMRRLRDERDLGPRKFVAAISPTGQLVEQFGRIPGDLEAADMMPAQDELVFVNDHHHTFRVAMEPVAGLGWVAIGVQADRFVREIERAMFAMGVGAVLLMIAIGSLVWVATGSPVREMELLTSELEALEAVSLDRRLHPRETVEVDRLTEALNRLLGRLEVAMRRAQRMAADVAHELRTPLAGLRAQLDVALARPASVATYREGLVDAIEQTERLSELAEDLLTLSVLESTPPGSTQAVDVSALAKEVSDFLDPVAQEQERRFTVRITPGIVIGGETPLLKRLLFNLLGNAFTHTARGVPVELDVGSHDNKAELVVRDQGQGMPKTPVTETAELRSDRRGAGLGLAICREIVSRHQGTLQVGSWPGRGTEVTVRLPLLGAGTGTAGA